MANRILAGMFLLIIAIFCAAVAVARATHHKGDA